ncbi:hypothetical protein ACEXQE_10085 [Herbiconiux sp. P17]|uniref:hypothetical protein n=1 Tax=Herbiconiux wuyangfengii TaxID=3342794 RepID=UPI0035B99CC7
MSLRPSAPEAGRRRHRAAMGVGCVILAAALAGCTAGSAASDAAATSPASSAASSSAGVVDESDDLHYPDGASADTPECQDASSAVLTAVNATIDNPLPGGAGSVEALTATPDPEHAVWLLTGAIASTPGAEGYLVSWATTADPTQDPFTRNLRSVGSQTATVSSAPVLQFPDVAAPGAFPAAALHCAPTLPRNSSR